MYVCIDKIHINNNDTSGKTLREEWKKILMLLVPITPHLAHECVEKIDNKFYWPKFNEEMLKEENCKIVIQVNGRKRGILEMPANSEEMIIVQKSKEIENVAKHIENREVIKNIYIKNKLVNFITKK